MTGQAFLVMASLGDLKRSISIPIQKVIIGLLIVQFIVFAILIINPDTRGFQVPQTASALVLAGFVIPLQIMNYLRNKTTASLLIVTAIVYGLLPGYVYNNQISVSRWFNYHDISHLLVVVYMIIMIFAIRRLAFKSGNLSDELN